MGKKRTFTKEFKIEILRELESKSAAEVCRQHGLNAVLINRWKREYDSNPKEAFSGRGKTWKDEAKLSEYKQLVGELYAENAFLKKVLENLQEQKAEEKRMRSNAP